MNILKIIRNAYQMGKLSLKQLIPMELLVASHLKAIIKNPECQERKYLRKIYLKARMIQKESIFLNKLVGVFGSIIVLIGIVSLTLLIIQ